MDSCISAFGFFVLWRNEFWGITSLMYNFTTSKNLSMRVIKTEKNVKVFLQVFPPPPSQLLGRTKFREGVFRGLKLKMLFLKKRKFATLICTSPLGWFALARKTHISMLSDGHKTSWEQAPRLGESPPLLPKKDDRECKKICNFEGWLLCDTWFLLFHEASYGVKQIAM